jgi:hypothetical protein
VKEEKKPKIIHKAAHLKVNGKSSLESQVIFNFSGIAALQV